MQEELKSDAKMGIREIGFGDGKWIDLAEGFIQRRAFIPAVLIL